MHDCHVMLAMLTWLNVSVAAALVATIQNLKYKKVLLILLHGKN